MDCAQDGLRSLGLDLLRDRFAVREEFLYIDCYYDGMCDEGFVELELKKVSEIIEDVKKMLGKFTAP